MRILAAIGLAGPLVITSVAAAGPPQLRDPEGIAVVGSTIVVTDHAANAVFAVNPSSHSVRKVARVSLPTAVVPLDKSHALVATGRMILRIDVRTGHKQVAARVRTGPVTALATAPNGIYAAVAGGSTIVRIDRNGKARFVLGNRLKIRSLLFQQGKLIMCEYGDSRFLIWNLAKKQLDLEVITIAYTTSAVAVASGWYVSSPRFGQLFHVSRAGNARPYANLPGVLALGAAGDGTFVATTLRGQVVRVFPQTHTIAAIVK